jgi:tRNA(Leu) C34 or U34 (ribose-2'-O)-methylase TrmL
VFADCLLQEEIATVVSNAIKTMPTTTPQLLVTDRVGFGQRKKNLERSSMCATPHAAHSRTHRWKRLVPEKYMDKDRYYLSSTELQAFNAGGKYKEGKSP